MAVPKHIKDEVSEIIWKEADQLDWTHLNIAEKSSRYKIWAKDDRIGKVLTRYMPVERVHPYIKDSLLKPYAKSKKLEAYDVQNILNLDEYSIVQEYVKPLGFRLEDGRIACWGRALDWKIVLLATFERSCEAEEFSAHTVILMESHGKFSTKKFQHIVSDACEKLKIDNIKFK
jgi:hypothetical protein